MKKLSTVLILLLLGLLGLLGLPARAQAAPQVIAVFFYSPSCPHCHIVIDNHLPGIQEEFGDALRILFIDVNSQGGAVLITSAFNFYEVPTGNRGVPFMVIGDTYLMGSVDIPQQMPQLVRDGLAAGGIGIPEFPGIREAYEALLEREAAASATAAAAEAPAESAAEAPAEVAPLGDPLALPEPTLLELLQRDPWGNAVAIVVLAMLVLSVLVVLYAGMFGQLDAGFMQARISGGITLLLTFLSAAAAFSIAAPDGAELMPRIAAALALALFAGGSLAQLRKQPTLAFLGIALGGLVVAAYLAYVEVGAVEVTCGLVGDCNTVQASPYAKLFGVLPVGVLGVVGYLLMIGAFGLAQRGSTLAQAALFLMALGGVGFSAYLTYLEPFVIGATCMWCITSALAMLAILWQSAPAGWRAIDRLQGGHHLEDEEHEEASAQV